MFGLNILQLYFSANFIYTIISFLFLHSIVTEKMQKSFHKEFSKYLTKEEARTAMNIYYIVSTLIGSFQLFKDILMFIFDHKECIWLHRIYQDKE